MNDVVASAKIYERVPIPRSQRTSKILRYTPGNVIPADRAKALNVSADGTQGKIPTAGAESTSTVPLAAKKTAAPAKKATKAKAAKKTAKAAKKA